MFRKVKRYLKDPYYALGDDLIQTHPEWMSDKFYLSVLWRHVMGYKLDWKNPKTFNEKLQWLKLNDRNPLYTTLVDKYAVKQWVADKIGEQYIIPTIAVYDSVDEINLDELPDRFVLKCTHDSGSIAICSDKSSFDFEKAKLKLQKGLDTNFYLMAREWPYKNVPHRIIAEELIQDQKGKLNDYKFTCTNGVSHNVMCCYDREINDVKFYFFDKQWNLLRLNKRGISAPLNFSIERPKNLDKMFQLASILSENLPYARVDFYNIDGKIYFGEITLYPQGGFDKNLIPETEITFGQLIKI